MNWIIASSLMFLSSVALYLCVRQSNVLKTPQQLNNLAMFLVPVVAYAVMASNTDIRWTLTPMAYLIIMIQGIFFSFSAYN